ncbi:MAG: hypothetical protein ACI89X_003981 [Planctomycetota bacterium]|jgi:hypothetical protein
MASNDRDLNKLNSLLSQCLGRINEEAFRMQEKGEDVDFDTGDRLEDETGTLQELIESMLVVELDQDETNINQVVTRVAEACLQEVAVPIVLRQTLTTESSLVVAPAALVNVAVQRAMVLAVTPLGPGDELRLTTRVDSGSVLFEIESLGSHSDDNAGDHAETLREFVKELGGTFQLRRKARDLFLVLELPQVMATDRSESL